MINIYINSNCYIIYAQDKLSQFKKILDLEESGKAKIFYQPNIKDELLRKPTILQKEKLKITKSLESLDYREAPFTIGISRVGSPDYLSRFSNRKEKSTDVTIQEIKNKISKVIFPNKKFLSNSDKNDIEFYSEAVNLGCEYFITQNTKDFGKAKTKKRREIECFDERVQPICKIRTVDDFLNEIKIVEAKK